MSEETIMARTQIPLAVPDLRGREAEYLTRCVSSNWVSSAGPEVMDFERLMAEITGRREAVATMNGTSALHLALVVAGIGRGDTVIVPDWTFAATANAVLHAGALPFFVDVSEESWTLDPDLLECALSDTDGRFSAVLAVHALGHPADMDAIQRVSERHGVPLIEDAAGAIGAFYKGNPVGSIGDAAVFSFNGNKTVTAGGGGMIVTDNEKWAARARALSTQSRDGVAYRYNEPGFNCRMPNVNAALGLAQLERLDEMVSAKRTIAARYDNALADHNDLSPMPRCAWAKSGCWLYSVQCPSRTDAGSLVTHLAKAGIVSRVFWEALSDQAPYAEFRNVRSGVARSLSGTVVSLPCSSQLTEDEQNRVIASLNHFNAISAAQETGAAVT